MKKVDVCDWWTQERIEAEEAIWQRDRFFVEYANQIRTFMREHDLKTVIELGCGSGHVAKELNNEFQYLGCDGSGLMVKFAREKNPGHKFEVLNLRGSHSWSTADLVCSFAVLKHFSLEEWKQILANMLSVGRYGMVQVQVRTDGFPSVEDGKEMHHNWLNQQELAIAVEAAGHEVLEIRISPKDVSPYMDHAAEALLLTKRQTVSEEDEIKYLGDDTEPTQEPVQETTQEPTVPSQQPKSKKVKKRHHA